MKISIEATINAENNKVWDYYTKPEHIIHWNFASDDWCCPMAENNMVVGGKYFARMEARDKSFGFDFITIYKEIRDKEYFLYTMEDGRDVSVSFAGIDNITNIKIVFDAEKNNSEDLQKNGWQAILNNFKKYVENSNNK
ncbi:MAG: SRPBCC domain-containing protein [Spirochaetales bacterium]|nr:SRPBCC domain-containing protein [Spirochaetales bacterium]